jgi:hypothetical protein
MSNVSTSNMSGIPNMGDVVGSKKGIILVGLEKLCADASTAKEEFNCIAVRRFGPLACNGLAMDNIVATKKKAGTNLILIQSTKTRKDGDRV